MVGLYFILVHFVLLGKCNVYHLFSDYVLVVIGEECGDRPQNERNNLKNSPSDGNSTIIETLALHLVHHRCGKKRDGSPKDQQKVTNVERLVTEGAVSGLAMFFVDHVQVLEV